MTSATTIVRAVWVACATALSGCSSPPQPTSQTAQAATPAPQPGASQSPYIRLSLQQQFGKAVFRECRLDIGTYDGDGSAHFRCERYGVPPKELSGNRKLTAEEVARVVRMVREGNLFAGDHVGVDGTGSDGPPFETLRVSVGTETAVLVTSGNPAFTTGTRQQLLDWLHAAMRDLQERAN